MSLRIAGLTLCTAAMLAACSPAQKATVDASIATAQVDAQNALVLYGIAKGIAQVAVVGNPTLAPAIAAFIAKADPLVAKAQMALADASTDAVALEALVAQIQAQANAMTVTAAPSVDVVAAK